MNSCFHSYFGARGYSFKKLYFAYLKVSIIQKLIDPINFGYARVYCILYHLKMRLVGMRDSVEIEIDSPAGA